jgi:tRNA modification GTPase
MRCIVVDLSAEPDPQLRNLAASHFETPSVIIANKADLLSADELAEMECLLQSARIGPVCIVSARTGAGLDACLHTITDRLHANDANVGGESLMLTARQREGVESAIDRLVDCVRLAQKKGAILDHADVLAFELRDALQALGTVAGSVTTEELLGRVFANFCIGK